MIGISFIIPYYALEQGLLLRAVDSIALARLECDYEIIVVDDGTPDRHAEEWLRGRDSHIRYFRKENGGLSDARNAGIALATKEYIQFLDSDDYLFPAAYRKVVAMLTDEQPDMLIFKSKKVFSKGIDEASPHEIHCERFVDGIDYMINRNVFAGACSYLFKREALSDLRFIKGIYHEDEDFTPRLIANCGSLIATDAVCYAYYQRQGSIVNDSDDSKLEKRFNDMLQIIAAMDKLSREATDDRRQRAFTRRRDQLALGILYTALTDLKSASAVIGIADRLASLDLWPLPKARYSRRYWLFRRLSNRRWKLRIIKTLLNLR